MSLISETVLRNRVIDRSRDDRRKKGSAENSAVTPYLPEVEGGILFFSTFYFEKGGIPLDAWASEEILRSAISLHTQFWTGGFCERRCFYVVVRDSGVIEMINERFLPEVSHRENGRTIVRKTKCGKVKRVINKNSHIQKSITRFSANLFIIFRCIKSHVNYAL